MSETKPGSSNKTPRKAEDLPEVRRWRELTAKQEEAEHADEEDLKAASASALSHSWTAGERRLLVEDILPAIKSEQGAVTSAKFIKLLAPAEHAASIAVTQFEVDAGDELARAADPGLFKAEAMALYARRDALVSEIEALDTQIERRVEARARAEGALINRRDAQGLPRPLGLAPRSRAMSMTFAPGPTLRSWIESIPAARGYVADPGIDRSLEMYELRLVKARATLEKRLRSKEEERQKQIEAERAHLRKKADEAARDAQSHADWVAKVRAEQDELRELSDANRSRFKAL